VLYISDIVEFLQRGSGLEQMDTPLKFGRTINAKRLQSQLSRAAREAPGDKDEVHHNVLCGNWNSRSLIDLMSKTIYRDWFFNLTTKTQTHTHTQIHKTDYFTRAGARAFVCVCVCVFVCVCGDKWGSNWNPVTDNKNSESASCVLQSPLLCTAYIFQNMFLNRENYS